MRDRDLSDPPSTGNQTNREVDRRVSTDGQKTVVASISGGVDGGSGNEKAQNKARKGKGSAAVAKAHGGNSNNGRPPKEEGGRGVFQLLEKGSNFPLFSHGEDGNLTFDRRSAQIGQRNLGWGENRRMVW